MVRFRDESRVYELRLAARRRTIPDPGFVPRRGRTVDGGGVAPQDERAAPRSRVESSTVRVIDVTSFKVDVSDVGIRVRTRAFGSGETEVDAGGIVAVGARVDVIIARLWGLYESCDATPRLPSAVTVDVCC